MHFFFVVVIVTIVASIPDATTCISAHKAGHEDILRWSRDNGCPQLDLSALDLGALLMEASINDAVAFQLVSMTNESDLRHMIFEYEPLPDQEEEG